MFVDDKYYISKRSGRSILEEAKSHAKAMNYPRRKQGFWARLFGL